jgi:hypothetical protein
LRTWYLGEAKEGQVGEAQPWEDISYDIGSWCDFELVRSLSPW